MSEPNLAHAPPLPRSFYFITVSRGSAMQTHAIRASIIHAAFCLLAGLVVWSCGAALYLAFHDDVIAAVYARETRMQYAYEERLAALRNEIDRQARTMQADQARVNGRLHDLSAREAELENRAETVARFASRASTLHDHSPDLASTGSTRAPSRPAFLSPSGPALPAGVMGFAEAPSRAPSAASPLAASLPASGKPHPEAEPLFEPDNPPEAAHDKAQGRDVNRSSSLPVPTRVAQLAATLDRLERQQTGLLSRIGEDARANTAHLRDILSEVGLGSERFLRRDADVGGPFVSAPIAGASAFDRAAAELRETVDKAFVLQAALRHVPLAPPLPGNPEITSPFGTRVDPFLGRLALHTGADLREDFGVDVKATATGRVTSAGPLGGYGNMVELDHGNGLRTRYAHLSEIDVSDGQEVPVGGLVGRVGATGRATGPHLHYEVRIDGEPVDPVRFLDAGLRLAAQQR